MKCTRCGAVNPLGAKVCSKCGKVLLTAGDRVRAPEPARAPSDGGKESRGPAPGGNGHINHDDIASKLKLDYIYARKDQNHRVLEEIQTLLAHFQKPHISLNEVLNEAAGFIWRQFLIKEVTVGLKSDDGLYRYEAMVGLREDNWLAHKSLTYKYEDFFENVTYKGRMISKFTKLLLAEDNPYGPDEQNTYDRAAMLESKRGSLLDSIEGDYLDIHMLSPNGDIVGWIEISGTRLGKLPDADTIKAIETIGAIIGAAVSVHRTQRATRK